MKPRLGRKTPLALSVFVVVFVSLAVSSYSSKSATWDEPQQIVAGYAALALHDYRLDPEHPPLVRMWAALPLLFANVRFDPEAPAWKAGDAYLMGHEFLYRDNDATPLVRRARFMIVLLGVGLGLLLFAWARELYGFGPATGVLALYACEPNILAHTRLVTTDIGVTAFLFGSVYFLWRLTRRFAWPAVAGATLFAGLAMTAKYSALILAPLALALLAARVLRPGGPDDGWGADVPGRLARAGAVALALGLGCWFMLWAAFGFRHAPTPPPDRRLLTTSAASYVQERAPRLARAVGWIDEHHLLPNAASQGFLFGQARARQRPAYLNGRVRQGGWWYYFPAAFAMKTPLVLLLAAAAGLALFRRRCLDPRLDPLFVLLPPAMFLGAAMTMTINIGLRHILPVYPFVLLAAGATLAWLFERRRAWVVLVALAAASETLPIHPDYLTFFNRAAGGPRQGDRRLLDSNLDWGQDLPGLARWMKREGVDHVNLAYFGTADPGYHGVTCTYLYGAPFYAEDRISEPRLPGYVAVSATHLHGVYLDPAHRDYYRPLLERAPVTVIGNTIHVYHVERPWW